MSSTLHLSTTSPRHFESREELERFLEENADKINWYWIPEDNSLSLSEEFLEKFSHKVNWYRVFRLQDLSVDFLIKHANKIKDAEDVYALIENKHKPLEKIESRLQLIRILFSINNQEARRVLRKYWYSLKERRLQ